MSRKSRMWWVILLAGVTLVVMLVSLSVQAAPSAGYNPNALSYGLYWFGKGNANQKFVSGEANPYFDPAKPTLIFAHGWQPYLSYNLPNFDFDGNDTIAAWIDDGWNVGIFVWNQFSDERTGLAGEIGFPGGEPPQGVLDAEAKIWTPDGPQGMRWYDWDAVPLVGGYVAAPAGTPSAAELFYEAYTAALDTYTGTVRIAGHSLGNQMAVRLTKLVDDGIAAGELSEHLRPARVALLDPYWSPDPRTYLGGKTTGEVVREYVAELLPTGTLFEWYWSSEWTTPDEGDANDALKPMVLYAAMDPAYASNDLDKHMAANHLYFWSYGFPQSPPCAGVGDDCRLLGQMSDAQLASLMRSDYYWTQSEGQATATPADDVYTATQRADAPYVVTQLQADPPAQTVGGVITVTATVTSPPPLSLPLGGRKGGAGEVLVTFGTDLGDIWARSVTSGGVALAIVTSDVAGTAHISATTQGAGGAAQSTLVVRFTEPVSECIPLTGAAITDLTGLTGTLYVDTPYTFTAAITPAGATPPITYTWSPTPTNGQNHSSGVYRWAAPDTYTLTLTAENCGGLVEAAPRVVVVTRRQDYFIYLPLVLR